MASASPAIHRLLLADLTVPAGAPHSGEPYLVHAFLISHPAGAILVDSGIGSGVPAIDEAYRPRRYGLSEALEGCGAALGQVVAIVNTHLHFDHCGGNAQLPGRPIHVQPAELEAARTPYYTVPEWLDFEGVVWRPREGEYELAEGVRVIPTPGHTPGHQSVLVEGEGGRSLICGQAAYDGAEFASHPADAEAGGESLASAYRDSFAVLHRLGADEVFFSHDPQSWKPA